MQSDGQHISIHGELATANLVATLSRALDLTEGESMGHAIRTCWIGMQMADRLHVPQHQQAELYYALLLKDAGCSANAEAVAEIFGADDRRAKHALRTVDWTHITKAMRFAVSQSKPDAPLMQRIGHVLKLVRQYKPEQLTRDLISMRCTRGADIIRELGWVTLAPEGILSLDEHWDGSGFPHGLTGQDIPLFARIALLAQTAEMYWRQYGLIAARDVVRQRRGSWFDPELVEAFLALSANNAFRKDIERFSTPEAISPWDPACGRISLDSMDAMLDIARVFAQIVDTKSSWTASHSIRTAHYSAGLAEMLGWDRRAQQEILLAGFFHDLGKLGISNTILDKPGPLSFEERRTIEQHPELTYQILYPMEPLRSLAEIAASHHERLDGSGYYRQLTEQAIQPMAQVIAVADVYDALSHARPYRRQLTSDEVLAIMRPQSGNLLSSEALSALEWGITQNVGPFGQGLGNDVLFVKPSAREDLE